MTMISGHPKRAFFIVLEGLDGSGTTTQGKNLLDYLEKKGEKAILTHEPSVGPVGMLIRLALSGRLLGSHFDFHDEGRTTSSNGPLDARTLALLYAADRHDHLHTLINASLDQGTHVICDRYVLSSLAYQGVSVDTEWVLYLNRFTRIPDITVYLDVTAERARLRMSHSRVRQELYENIKRQEQVRRSYQRVIDDYGDHLGKVLVLDADASIKEVARRVRAVIDDLLKTGGGPDFEPEQAVLQFE